MSSFYDWGGLFGSVLKSKGESDIDTNVALNGKCNICYPNIISFCCNNLFHFRCWSLFQRTLVISICNFLLQFFI